MEDKSNTTEQHSKESEVKQDDLFDLFKNPAKFQPSPATKLRRISTPKRKNREGEEDSERTRTPSGLAITPSVGDLTSIIEKQCYLNNPQKRLNTSAVSASGDCSSVSKHGKQHKHDQSRLSKDSDRRLLSVSSLELHLQSDKLQPTNAEVRSEDQRKMPEENSVRGDIKEGGREIEEQNATDHPTMDIRTVVQMLSELKADLTREFDQKMNNIVASMQKPNIAEDVKKDIQTVKMKTEVCEIKNRMVADTMANLHDRIKELEQRVENQEINANKKAVILSGFEASEKKTVARQQLMNFFTEVLCIDVVMEDFYSIGQNSPRDIAIIFLSANHKRSLFQNIEKIKNLRNTHGKKYVFRDMMTAKQNDFRQRSQQIADGVSRMDSVNREDVTVDKNRIYVGNEEYQEPVTPPNPTSVLRYSSPKLNEIMMKHVDRDPNISEYVKGNKFTAYSMCTDNFVDINDAYMKIRLNHAEARHIICAWNIPGVKRYECEGSCDDDDYGVSKHVLQLMLDNNITSRAIYIVRNYGEKLYGDRIPCYVNSAVKVINTFPFNPVANVDQKAEIREQFNENGVAKTYSGVLRSGNTSQRGKFTEVEEEEEQGEVEAEPEGEVYIKEETPSSSSKIGEIPLIHKI